MDTTSLILGVFRKVSTSFLRSSPRDEVNFGVCSSVHKCTNLRSKRSPIAVHGSTTTTAMAEISPIPQPPTVPFLGNARLIDSHVPLHSFELLARQYGEIYKLVLTGGKSLVAVNSHALTRQGQRRHPLQEVDRRHAQAGAQSRRRWALHGIWNGTQLGNCS